MADLTRIELPSSDYHLEKMEAEGLDTGGGDLML